MRKLVSRSMFASVAILVTALMLTFTTGCATLKPQPEVIQNYEQAKELYQDEKYDAAITAFDRFMNNYPESELAPAGMYYKARSLQEKGETQRAQQTYQNLINKYKSGAWVDLAKANLQDMQ